MPRIRERAPGVWEITAAAGRDPRTGCYGQISRTVRGTKRAANQAAAELLTETWPVRGWSCSLVEALFPGQDGVVHLNRPGTDEDRSLHAFWRYADVEVPRATVQGLRSVVVRTNRDAQATEAPSPSLLLGRRRERRRDATSSVLGSRGNVLQFWGIGQGQVCMSERLVMLPRHEIEAVPLVKAGKAQNSGHTASPNRRRC